MAFGLPWSSALFRVGLYGLFFFYLLSGNWRNKWEVVTRQKLIWTSIALTLVIYLSLSFTSASPALAQHDAARYLKLLSVIVLVYMLDSDRKRILVLLSFSMGIVFLMVPTVLDGTGLVRLLGLPIESLRNQAYHQMVAGMWSQNLVYLRNQLEHGFFISILCFVCLICAVHLRRYSLWFMVLAIICAVDIVFFIRGRMALLNLVACLFLFSLSQMKSTLHKALATLALVCIFLTAYVTVPAVQKRIDSMTSETSNYLQKNDTSTGAGSRFHYWLISWNLFKQSPIIGTGAGAFRHHLEQSQDPFASQGHSHTHNEYITQASQYGLIGLSLFLLLLGQAIKNTQHINNIAFRDICRAGVFIFSLNCFTDSLLYNVHEGWTLVLLLSLISSASSQRTTNQVQ